MVRIKVMGYLIAAILPVLMVIMAAAFVTRAAFSQNSCRACNQYCEQYDNPRENRACREEQWKCLAKCRKK